MAAHPTPMSVPGGRVVFVLKRLRARQEWQFFAVLPKADPVLATVWWALLILNGAMPAVFAVAIGATVGAVEQARPVAAALALTGVVFVLMLIVNPIQTAVSMNLGNKVSAWLNEALIRACVQPPGIGHLEDPDLADDLTTAREFDRGMTGPPMYLNVDFIATSLVSAASGVASAVVLIGFSWWAPLVLVAAWGSTHWLLRESGVWKDRNTPEVRSAQRHADYAYQLAVDPQPAKELRLFGLAGWTVERFVTRRKRLFELQYRATRLREKSVIWCMLIVIVANAAVFGALGLGAVSGDLALDELVVYAQVALGVSLIAFGGLNWALDGAAAPVAAVARLGPAMAPLGRLAAGPESAAGMPNQEIAFHDVSFVYPGSSRAVHSGLDLTVQAGTSLAIVGQNGAGKTTLAKLLCRLYDPTEPTYAALNLAVGGAASQRSSRTLSASSCPCVRMSTPHERPAMTTFGPHWSTRARPTLPSSTRRWRRDTATASTSRVASGSASPWRGLCARCDAAPGWCCSTSRQRSSMSAARQRCSTRCCRRPVTPPRS